MVLRQRKDDLKAWYKGKHGPLKLGRVSIPILFARRKPHWAARTLKVAAKVCSVQWKWASVIVSGVLSGLIVLALANWVF